MLCLILLLLFAKEHQRRVNTVTATSEFGHAASPFTFHNRRVEHHYPGQGAADHQQQHGQTDLCNGPATLPGFGWFLHYIHLAFRFAHIPPDCRLCRKDTVGVWDGPRRELPSCACVCLCVWAVQRSIRKLCQLTCSKCVSTRRTRTAAPPTGVVEVLLLASILSHVVFFYSDAKCMSYSVPTLHMQKKYMSKAKTWSLNNSHV